MTNEFKQRLIEQILGEHDSPLPHYLGISAADIREGYAKLTFKVRENSLNGYHIVHGGALMTLADCAMGMACFTYQKKVVTIDANISYLKSSPLGTELECTAKVLHNGNRTMVAACDITNADGTLQTQARGTFFVVGTFT